MTDVEKNAILGNVQRQYVGARYVPKFFQGPDGTPTWVGNVPYEALTIVTYLGNSYTSKVPVPAGIGNPSTNPTYWALTGNYNAQVEEYRKAVEVIEENLKNITVFITPEMFGARGDGETDDSKAIQECLTTAISDKKTVMMCGTYATDSTIDIYGNHVSILGGGNIIYNGSGYALTIHQLRNSEININSILCKNGNAINFITKDENDWSQYVNIYISQIMAAEICVNVDSTRGGWINEIRLNDCVLSDINYVLDGQYKSNVIGLKFNESVGFSGWRLTNIGFENIGTGVIINNVGDTSAKADLISIISPRANENIGKLLSFSGYVTIVLIHQNRFLNLSLFELSQGTNGTIIGNINNSQQSVFSNIFKIISGVISPYTPIMFNYNAQTNPIINMGAEDGGFYRVISLNRGLEYIINLNNLYAYNMLNEFLVRVNVGGASLKIQAPNGTQLFPTTNMVNGWTYHFYFNGNELLHYCTPNEPTT